MNVTVLTLYAIVAVAVYLTAFGMLNLQGCQRRWTAATLAATWPVIAVLTIVVVIVDIVADLVRTARRSVGQNRRRPRR